MRGIYFAFIFCVVCFGIFAEVASAACPNWYCYPWTPCQVNLQQRYCYDKDSCGNSNPNAVTQYCSSVLDVLIYRNSTAYIYANAPLALNYYGSYSMFVNDIASPVPFTIDSPVWGSAAGYKLPGYAVSSIQGTVTGNFKSYTVMFSGSDASYYATKNGNTFTGPYPLTLVLSGWGQFYTVYFAGVDNNDNYQEWWVYVFYPSTCDDGIKDGDEAGVDCGGSCTLSPCASPPPPSSGTAITSLKWVNQFNAEVTTVPFNSTFPINLMAWTVNYSSSAKFTIDIFKGSTKIASVSNLKADQNGMVAQGYFKLSDINSSTVLSTCDKLHFNVTSNSDGNSVMSKDLLLGNGLPMAINSAEWRDQSGQKITNLSIDNSTAIINLNVSTANFPVCSRFFIQIFNGSSIFNGIGDLMDRADGSVSLSFPNLIGLFPGVSAGNVFHFNVSDNFGAASVRSGDFNVRPVVVNSPPNVNINSPSNNAQYQAPVNISISASATDDVGVAKVEFYNGVAKIGENTSGVGNIWTFQWLNVAVGAYTITANATDGQGFSKVSTPVVVNVVSVGGGYGSNPPETSDKAIAALPFFGYLQFIGAVVLLIILYLVFFRNRAYKASRKNRAYHARARHRKRK